MKIVGIDYGRKKIGLAINEGILAEPWKVIKVNDFEEAVGKVLQILKELKADGAVVGVSEGEMGEESKKFAERINAKTFDETLSTHTAQELSREAKVGRKKRKDLEDAFAASVMLQLYLDTYV
ncbi:MAG: Holliday junction resolvase RuvX [Candidatus Woesebacteria bacterium]|nr:Holliday junction resolvase RuvX [Candidatus Woesebacteria bacterium]